MHNTIFFPVDRCRGPLRRPVDPRRYRPTVEWFEPRQLLAGGPLQLTITEVETGQSVTVTDNAGTGLVGFSPPISPFTDFSIQGVFANSNRTSATTSASLTQTGLITRTTDTGVKTLKITATDTGFQNPLFPQTLFSFANVTFTNPTAADTATFQSFENATASPPITLSPSFATNPESKNGNAAPTPLTSVTPFSLSSVYTVALGPSTLGANQVRFQDTGLSTVGGTSQLSGTVFYDKNLDLIQQPDEPGLTGVMVALAGTDSAGNPVSLTTTTDASGFYVFAGLPPSNAAGYTVTETQPAGYLHVGQSVGSTGGTTGNHTITTVVGPNVNSIRNNFAEVLPSSLSGVVYFDTNNNGVKDSSDLGIANVLLTLTGTNGLGQSISATTTSDNNGSYTFMGLYPGTYSIQEAPTPQFLEGTNTVGTVNGTPVGALTGLDTIGDIRLTAGAMGVNYNFGEIARVGSEFLSTAFHVGRTVARLTHRRALHPARFDHFHPTIGPLLGQGIVPKGVGTFPRAPQLYALVPEAGTRPIQLPRHHLVTATRAGARQHRA